MKTLRDSPMTYAFAATIATVLQIAALVRYAGREPHDSVGIALYAITAILFAAVATGSFIAWRDRRRAS
jgi:hypothetical protein